MEVQQDGERDSVSTPPPCASPWGKSGDYLVESPALRPTTGRTKTAIFGAKMTYPEPQEAEVTPEGWVVFAIFVAAVIYLVYKAVFNDIPA